MEGQWFVMEVLSETVPVESEARAHGVPLVFVGPDPEWSGFRVFQEWSCALCGRVLLTSGSEGFVFEAACPAGHGVEVVSTPDGFERYMNMDRLVDLARMREAEAALCG